MVGVAALAYALSAPGQTAAISVVVGPITDELGLSRSAVSTAYLIGTLAGAVAMPWVGRLLDAFGARLTMAVVGAVFGSVLLGLAAVNNVVGLTVGFIGIRLAGQGALGLIATTVTAAWFSRRRGLALGLVSAVGSAGISLAPLGLEVLVAAHGFRVAWVVEGLVVWALVVPLALLGLRDRPADLGQVVDGARTTVHSASEPPGHTLAEAVRTRWFWVVVAGVAVSGATATAVAFHQIDLLGERGLTPTEAAANFLPQTVAGLTATVAAGVLVDRMDNRTLLAGCMAVLSGGLLWATVVTPGWSAIGFGLALGAAGGAIRTLEAGSFARAYGTTYLGSIRGVVTAVSVGSTSIGPLAFALVRGGTGGYGPALIGAAVLPALVALAALTSRRPESLAS